MNEHDDAAAAAMPDPADAGQAGASAGVDSAGVDPAGDPRVDAALTRLAELDGLTVHQHAAVIEDIHRSLQDTLAEEEG